MDSQNSLGFLWRRKWIVIAATLLTFTIAILLTLRMAKTYQAATLIQVDSVNAASTDPGAILGVQQASQGLATSYATVIGSSGFLQHIRPVVAGGRLSLSDLEARISASSVSGGSNELTNLIKLSARGPNPASARSLAHDVASAFVVSVRRGADADVSRQQTAIEAQIAALNQQITGARRRGDAGAEQLATLVAARNELVKQRAVVIANGITRSGSVHVASPATASSVPVSPRPLFNAVVGLLLGLLLGVGLAWLRERLDVGLHDADEAEKILEVPNLARIPLMKGAAAANDPLTVEAYDVLRTNLVFLGVDKPLKVVTFTSFNPGEGKSSAVAGLARAAQRSGTHILILDCDLRTGSLTKRLLGNNGSAGLTSLIVSDARRTGGRSSAVDRVADAIVPLDKGLALLPAGPLPPNPTSLLSSKTLGELIERFRDEYDLVVIDSPPAAHLADASLLASLSDAVVLVARVGTTKRKDIAMAAASLRHTPTPIVGAVVFERRTSASTYYPAPTRERAKAPRPAKAS